MSKRRKQLTPLHLRKSRQAILGNDRVKAWNKFDFCTNGYQNLQGQILPNRASDNMSSYSNYTSTTSTISLSRSINGRWHEIPSTPALWCWIQSTGLEKTVPDDTNVEIQALFLKKTHHSTNHWTPSTYDFCLEKLKVPQKVRHLTINPIRVSVSGKAFIGKSLPQTSPEHEFFETVATQNVCLQTVPWWPSEMMDASGMYL